MAVKLLRHPVPYMNESIGSYILRLCSANSCGVNQIADLIGFSNFRGIGNYYSRLKEGNITKISELTGIDIDVIKNMTANRFIFDNASDFSYGIEACVCPKCYIEKSYERIHWKNKLIKVCLDHEIYLVDECPRCKEKITSSILFNGKCACGLFVNEFVYAKCIDEYVIKIQNILYQIFNIRSKVKLEEDLLYNAISSEDYCKLLDHLQYLATIYAEDLNELEVIFENNRRIKNNIIASWIMFDWPTNLIKFLNILNYWDIKYIDLSAFKNNDRTLMFEYIDMISDRFKRISNPLECLKLNSIYYIVFRNKVIFLPIINYFYDNSNKENIKRKMDKYVCFNNYVELDMAIKIFFNFSDLIGYKITYITKYFHVTKFLNNKYLNLEEIIDFYNRIIKNCSILVSDIKEISEQSTSYYDTFQYFNITLGDIIQVLVNRKLKVKINPEYFKGLKYIYSPFFLSKKEFLLLLSNRIDVTD